MNRPAHLASALFRSTLATFVTAASHLGHSNVRRSYPGWSGAMRASIMVVPHLPHVGRTIGSDRGLMGKVSTAHFTRTQNEDHESVGNQRRVLSAQGFPQRKMVAALK